MSPVFGEKFPTENENGKSRYFEGSVTIDTTKVFKDEQSCVGKYSLELMNQDAFYFGDFADNRSTHEKFLTEEKYTDFALIAEDGSSFPCHKAFLAGNSPVFGQLLGTDEKVRRENCYHLKASPSGVKAFRSFIYTCDLSEAFRHPIIAVELLQLGDQFEIQLLKKKLEFLLERRADEWLTPNASVKLFWVTKDMRGFGELKAKAERLTKLCFPHLK